MVASFCQFDCSTADVALLVPLLSRGLLEFLLVLILLTDMILRSLIEQRLAASTCYLATSSVFANGIRDLRVWIRDVCERLEELATRWITAVYAVSI